MLCNRRNMLDRNHIVSSNKKEDEWAQQPLLLGDFRIPKGRTKWEEKSNRNTCVPKIIYKERKTSSDIDLLHLLRIVYDVAKGCRRIYIGVSATVSATTNDSIVSFFYCKKKRKKRGKESKYMTP